MKFLKNTLMILWLAIVSATVFSCSEKPENGGGSSIMGESAVNGTVKFDDGKPAVGVSVTDGYSVVTTDLSGKYSFTRGAKATFVYISLPANAVVPLGSGNGLPAFYKRLDRKLTEYNFTLKRQDVEQEFCLFALGDPQVKDAAQIRRFSSETAPDIKAYAASKGLPCYGITLGDIVGNKWDLYPDISKAMHADKMGLPLFQTIGNHDHEFPQTNDTQSKKKYESAFGPSYYSFNRGGVHIVSMDDVLHLASASTSYTGGLDDEKWNWLVKDLENVDRSMAVAFCCHIPPKAGEAFVEKEGVVFEGGAPHYKDLINLLGEFSFACIIAGHTHNNVTRWDSVASNGKVIHEWITGTTCGAWWHGTICTDGTPCGYGVFTFRDSELVNHLYKAVRYDDDFQFRLYRAADFPSFKWIDGSTTTTIKFPVSGAGDVVVNAWNATPAWKWEVYEDGVKTLSSVNNANFSKSYYDVWAKQYFYDIEKLTSSSYNGKYYHMLYFTLKNPSAQSVTLKATDQWDNVFERSIFTTNTSKDAPSGY